MCACVKWELRRTVERRGDAQLRLHGKKHSDSQHGEAEHDEDDEVINLPFLPVHLSQTQSARLQSSAAISAMVKAEAAAAAAAAPEVEWVQCDACGKWRLVGLRAANQFAEHFTCRDNPDPKHRWCETPQELPDDEIDRQLGLAPPPPPLALPAPGTPVPARKPSLLDSARVL